MKVLIHMAACTVLGCAGVIGPSAAVAGPRHDPAAHGAGQKHAHERPFRTSNRHASIDRSGRVQIGKASVYSRKFIGRRMAGGARFQPVSDSAASRTLPLGTVAAVTNLETGRTATVRIRDRGPYRADRILDVSPRTAEELGMEEDNVVRVAVVPVAEP